MTQPKLPIRDESNPTIDPSIVHVDHADVLRSKGLSCWLAEEGTRPMPGEGRCDELRGAIRRCERRAQAVQRARQR